MHFATYSNRSVMSSFFFVDIVLPMLHVYCVPGPQEVYGWSEKSTYERLRKSLNEMTKRTADRSMCTSIQ